MPHPDPDCQQLCSDYPEAVALIAEAAGMPFADVWAGAGPDPEDPAFVARVWALRKTRTPPCDVGQRLRHAYPALADLMEHMSGIPLETLMAAEGAEAEAADFVLMVERVCDAILTPKGWLREEVLSQCDMAQLRKPLTKLRKAIKAQANAVQRPEAARGLTNRADA